MILHPREKISYLRKEYGITQKELGQEEFSQSYIASLENGQRELRDEILLSIWKNWIMTNTIKSAINIFFIIK